MGVSYYDLINGKKPPATPQGVSYYDKIKSQVSSQSEIEEPDATEEMQNKVGNLFKYTRSTFDVDNQRGVTMPVLEKLGENIKESIKGEYERIKQGIIDTFTKSPFHIISDPEEKNNALSPFIHPIDTAAGFVTSMADQAEKTVGSLTNTVNENGVARPATVEEQAKNLQSVAGSIAQIALFKSIKGSSLAIPKTAQEVAALSRYTKPGLIARNMAVEGFAAAASGATQAAITEMGNPAQQEAAVAAALTYVPIGMAYGLLGGKGYIKDLESRFDAKILKPSEISSSQLAALNDIRTRSNDNIETISKKVDFVNKSDLMTEAAIRNRIDANDGFIVDGLPDDVVANITNKFGRSRWADKEPNYQEHPELKDRSASFRKSEVNFESPLDKIAYLAATKKKPTGPLTAIINDALQQTGVSLEELKNHGLNVKEELKKNNERIPRSQYDLDKLNRDAQLKGETMILSSRPGDEIVDAAGQSWIRGDNTVQNKQGLVYPTNSQEAHMILGRDKSYEYKSNPLIPQAKLKFNPDFGKDIYDGVNIYRGPNKETLVTRATLNEYGRGFFEKTGYLPGEIVSMGGKDHFIMGGIQDDLRLKDASTGQEVIVSPNWVRRTSNSLHSVANAEGFTKIGKLTKETYLDDLYKKYMKAYQETPESFSSFNQKFFTKQGIQLKDIPNVETYMYKRMGEDIAKDVLSPDELATRSRLKTNLEVNSENYTNNLAEELDYLAKSNGMYYEPLGSGKYNIKTLDGGWSTTVTSPDEVFEAIRRSRQISSYAFDGGKTNVVDPAVARISNKGLDQQFSPKQIGGFEKFYDQSTANGFLSKFAPVVRRFASADNATKITNLLGPALKIQDAQLAKKATALRPEFVELTNMARALEKQGRGLTQKERWVVQDYRESASADEIANNSLHRPLNDFEKRFAATLLNKVNIDDLRKMMYEAKVESGKAIGTKEYEVALNNVAKRYDPSLQKVATQLISSGNKLGPELFSPTTVMDYAGALNDPGSHLTRDEFWKKKGMTQKQLDYAHALDAYYEKAGAIAGIDPKAKLNRYSPRVRNNVLEGSGSVIPEDFARELERFGITGSNMSERDPNDLVRIYHSSLLNHVSGFSKSLGEANTQFQKQIQLLRDQAQASLDQSEKMRRLGQWDAVEMQEQQAKHLAKMADAMEDVAETYIQDSRGIPNIADQSAKATTQFYKNLGLKTPEQNSVLQLFSLGNIALRPALAMRDMAQTLGNVYISFGHEFAQKAFTGSLSQEYMVGLQKKGIIPKLDAGQLIDPGSSGTGGLFNKGLLQKMTESGYKLSGQELAYNRMLAGIFKATHEIGARELENLRLGRISKEVAYERIGLHNHGPSVQAEFDKLVTQKGRPDEALDFLGKWNGRYSANIFGMANNPSGWNTNFGRLLGQYGSWSANATHTLLEQWARGTKKQVLGKIMRTGIVMAAAGGASQVSGLKLFNWAAGNPLSTLPGVGPVVSEGSELMKAWQTTGDPSAVLRTMGGDALGFVPYYRALKDWKKSYELLDQNDARFIPQAIGIQAKR